MIEITKSSQFKNCLKESLSRSLLIPFGNSKWQIDSIVSNEKTPERAYRALLLNFHTKFNDLKTAERKRRKDIIKVKLLSEDIEKEKNPLKKELLQIDIEEIESGFDYTNKLALDCADELNYMWKYIEKMPQYSRKDFENGEIKHFKLRGAEANNKEFLLSIQTKQLKNNVKGELE